MSVQVGVSGGHWRENDACDDCERVGGGGARVQVHGPQQGDPALTFGLEHRVHGEARRDEHGVALRRC